MPTPVLVVDDSAMARKLLIKALPPTWDVAISQAVNGVEALEAYRAGKADIMFLDLTMPELDGFQVLERVQKEGLDSFVIVVSADVQPIARERVKKLGAMAFIRKPIDDGAVEAVLKQHGIAL